MAWVSKNAEGDLIKAETAKAEVVVETRGGNVVYLRGCKHYDETFRRLVRAAREFIAT
jgi:hypothetical protein